MFVFNDIRHTSNDQKLIFSENLMNEDSIQSWAEEEFKTNQEVIEDLSTEQLDLILEKHEYVLVFVCKSLE